MRHALRWMGAAALLAACGADDEPSDVGTDVADAAADAAPDVPDVAVEDAGRDTSRRDAVDDSAEPDVTDVGADAEVSEPDEAPDADVHTPDVEPDVAPDEALDEALDEETVDASVDAEDDTPPPACSPAEGIDPRPLNWVSATYLPPRQIRVVFDRDIVASGPLDPWQFRVSMAVHGARTDVFTMETTLETRFIDLGFAPCEVAELAAGAGDDPAPFERACEAVTDAETGRFVGAVDVVDAAPGAGGEVMLTLAADPRVEALQYCDGGAYVDRFCGLAGFETCAWRWMVHYASNSGEGAVYGLGDCVQPDAVAPAWVDQRDASRPELLTTRDRFGGAVDAAAISCSPGT